MSGLFAQFQPVYADLGIAAFPCSTDTKKPLVSNYLRMGIPATGKLTKRERFTDANALGIVCGAQNRITVLDIDSSDRGLLKEAIARHGQPRVIVQTASGKFHGYYLHAGEGRKIRPWKDLPIDVLGGGFVMAVPSLLAQGEYRFIEGQINDLKRLTPIIGLDGIERNHSRLRKGEPQARQGTRNYWLFGQCMRAAKRCDTFEALLDVARTRNEECDLPLEEKEVVKTAHNAWTYELENKNHYAQHGAYVHLREANDMMIYPDALTLLVWLRANEGPWGRFMIPNKWCDRFKWTLRRFQAARNMLIETHYIKQVKAAHTGSAALYEWDD